MFRHSSAAAVCASCLSTRRKGRTGPSFSSWFEVDDEKKIDGLIADIQKYLDDNYPNANAVAKKFLLGPGSGGRVQVALPRSRSCDAAPTGRPGADKSSRTTAEPSCVRSDWREP